MPVASFIFLLEWQHATPGTRLAGDAGLIEVVEQLQGFEAAAAAWESGLLMNRLTDFHASTLDALTLGGELAWGRFARRTGPPPSAALSRNGPVTLAVREDVPWLLDPPDPAPAFTGAAADVLAYLESSGASCMPDIVRGSRRLPSEVEEALWLLVAAGRVTADGFGALRGLSRASRNACSAGPAGRARRGCVHRRRSAAREAGGRCCSRRWPNRGRTWSRRARRSCCGATGSMLRELLAREPMAPPWGALVNVPATAEARGEVRGGRFVAGLVGEQFALPEAVDALQGGAPPCAVRRGRARIGVGPAEPRWRAHAGPARAVGGRQQRAVSRRLAGVGRGPGRGGRVVRVSAARLPVRKGGSPQSAGGW